MKMDNNNTMATILTQTKTNKIKIFKIKELDWNFSVVAIMINAVMQKFAVQGP